MGCSGSKYQALSADSVAKSNDGPSATATGVATATGDSPATAEPITPPKGPTTPSGTAPNTPGSSRSGPPAAVGAAPPWIAGSAIPEFEPPLVGSEGDDGSEDVGIENLEERFPPWIESNKARPPNARSEHFPLQPPPVPASSSSAVPSAWEPVTTFENTVIIFDWDDTLLCSSALHCCMPNQFVELEETVETILHASMKLGRTIIVTNAMESWITETTKRFMPRLIPTLERLLIVYARNNWERLWPGDTFAWKREAFRELLNDKLGHNLNLVVIGDSLSEIRAAEALAEFLGASALVKTVKFKALPSPTDLLGELRTIGPELSKLVEEQHSASKELCQDIPSGSLFQQNVFQGAPNWQLLDSVPNEMFSSPPGIFAPWSLPQLGQVTQITI